MTNYPTAKSPSADQSNSSCRSRARQLPAGLVLIIIGLLIVADRAQLHLPMRVLGGFGLLLPLAYAVHVALRHRARTGEVSQGHLWWIFGTSFPAVVGLQRLSGVEFDSTWIVPVGFVLIGLAMVLGRSSRRSAR